MLNSWDASGALDERLCSCEVHSAEYLEVRIRIKPY